MQKEEEEFSQSLNTETQKLHRGKRRKQLMPNKWSGVAQVKYQDKYNRKIHYWPPELRPSTCKVSSHFATLSMTCDLTPPLVHVGILSEGERLFFLPVRAH